MLEAKMNEDVVLSEFDWVEEKIAEIETRPDRAALIHSTFQRTKEARSSEKNWGFQPKQVIIHMV